MWASACGGCRDESQPSPQHVTETQPVFELIGDRDRGQARTICACVTSAGLLAMTSNVMVSIVRTASAALNQPDARAETADFGLASLTRKRPHESDRVLVQPGRDSLQAAQCEVAFATLDAAPVGPMNAYHLGELLLGQPTGFANAAQVGADSSLKFALHQRNSGAALLKGLQTDE